jgi:hypothetical protein
MKALLLMACVVVGGAGVWVVQPPAEPGKAAPAAEGVPGVVELAPGLRVDRAASVVEFDGVVPVDVHDAQTPRVYLELFVTGPDTREHEALVMTRVPASAIHAGLLALGLEPGKPGVIRAVGAGAKGEAEVEQPTGPGLAVEFVTRTVEGAERVEPASSWVVNAEDGSRLEGEAAEGAWVFAGSRMMSRRDPATGRPREVYDADGTGVIVGLHTFSSEVIAWRRVMSPDAAALTPVWIADRAKVPEMGTKVVVRVRAVGAAGEAPK